MNVATTEEILQGVAASFFMGILCSFFYTLLLEGAICFYESLCSLKRRIRSFEGGNEAPPIAARKSQISNVKLSVPLLDTLMISVTALIFPSVSYFLLDGIPRCEMYASFILGFFLVYGICHKLWSLAISHLLLPPFNLTFVVIKVCISLFKTLIGFGRRFKNGDCLEEATKTDKL